MIQITRGAQLLDFGPLLRNAGENAGDRPVGFFFVVRHRISLFAVLSEAAVTGSG